MRRVADLLRIDGRVGIVTGGAGHIGGAIAEALVENGAHVVLVDREEGACEASARAVETHGGVEALGLAADLADPSSAKRVVEETLARFGRIDILVNNAAFTGASELPGYAVAFAEQSLEAWDAAIRVNLTSCFLLAQAAREALAARGTGSIVNIGSIYGVVGPNMNLYEGTPMGNPAAYGASKAGLVHLTRYLATVLAPAVRVNAVSPGGIERGQPEVFQERYAKLTPLRRMGTEEDLKGIVALLASDAGAYITGQNVLVDGGWTAW